MSLRKIVLIMAIASVGLFATAIASAGGNDYAVSAAAQSVAGCPSPSRSNHVSATRATPKNSGTSRKVFSVSWLKSRAGLSQIKGSVA